ncbi:MmgE/PrpD family protein [Pollutimonas thiosulfatoxidans]|uniref:2-methylcitrate dehydratase n=1 Tax=Pollutimonas thiosulfatoxidans TaxID=2028345 RepID=A0A410GFI1_9BURK|nr:MmgE/PrpD family protein [Pollutimonas thiosulfatoxidans]QAA95066.1 hypothetical protein CKA81_15255 [Pollutimonas thiosulfatoxidans]
MQFQVVSPDSQEADQTSMSLRLAHYIVSLQSTEIPDRVFDYARLMIADTLGVALAGSTDSSVAPVINLAKRDVGRSAIWGTNIQTTERNASLVNGALSHVLDFDDNNLSMIGHSCAPVLPGLLALADSLNVTLEGIVVAMVVGVQVESVLGATITLEHNARGWHTTATLGTFGATAACAKLLGLDYERTANALGIAASLIGGIRENFGTPTKAMHAGFAAQNGLLAARLAQEGLTSGSSALEGQEGFFALYGSRDCLGGFAEDLSSTFEILNSGPKVYPTCSMIHAGLDVVLQGLSSGLVRPDEVVEVECRVSYHAANIMRYAHCSTPAEARFCIPYCIAVALLYGSIKNEHFTDEAIQNEGVRRAMSMVKVTIDPQQRSKEEFEALYLKGEAYTTIVVTHADAPKYTGKRAIQIGHPANPLSRDGFKRKFETCTVPVIGAQRAEQLWNVLTENDAQSAFSATTQLLLDN